MANEVYQPSYRKSWGLVIGINDYQHIAHLSYACNDADAVANALLEDLGFPQDQVIILKDHEATKRAVLDAYLGLSEQASDPDDRVLVFFAGHGTTRQSVHGRSIGYLIPVDGDPKKLSTLVRWDDLTRNAELIPAKHILFIMDACYSGLAVMRAVPPGAQRFLTDMLQRFSRQAIAAGKADETVADGGGPHGQNSIFTGYLLEGLHGAAKDENGILTANALMHYVYGKVSKDPRSSQTPHYGHIDGDGDFVLLVPDQECWMLGIQQDHLVQAVEEVPGPELFSATTVVMPTFAEENGYSDPKHPSFGRNDWSARLGELRESISSTSYGDSLEYSRAFSWLSLIMEPVAQQPIRIDISKELDRFNRLRASGGQEPYDWFGPFQQSRTTSDSLVLFDSSKFHDPEFWTRYLRLDSAGNIEYADNSLVFRERNTIRHFLFVPIIGLAWQFMFLSKRLLVDIGYGAGVRFLVSLVGTQGSVLSCFARQPEQNGRHWAEPDFRRPERAQFPTCVDRNLRMEYRVVIGDLDETRSREIVEDVAHRLSLAYNLGTPARCFNYGTNVFPWNEYVSFIR